MIRWIKGLAVVLVILLLVCAGLIYFVLDMMNDVTKNPLSAFDSNKVVIENSEVNAEDNMVNVLLLGIDSNEEREEQHKGYRSDMIMLCTINFDTNQMSLLSIPRDTKAKVYHVDRDTGEVTDEETNKINAAYAFGGGPNYYGAENAMRCVSEFLSLDGKFTIPIDYYVSIDMDGITKMADAVGGVEVTLDMDLPGIGKEGEVVNLEGQDAIDYIRERKNVGGDTKRAYRQQQFIIGIAKKVKSMGAMSAAPKLYNQVIEFAKTNLELNQVLAFASLIDKIDIDTIEFYTSPGESENGGHYYYLTDEEGLEEMLIKILEDKDPIAEPSEQAA